MTTTSNTQRAQQLLAQEGLESISQKLYNEIYINLPGKPNAPRRWIWELLQNAKDVISVAGLIEINLNENSIEFSHNGSPFLHENLLALLSQNSTKKHNYSDDEKQEFLDRLVSLNDINENDAKSFLNISGRFGTGFMTTYLLSKKVSLEGIYFANGVHKRFLLSFDREVEKDTEMKEKVKNSFSAFTELEQANSTNNIVNNYQEGVTCDTKFIYEFDDGGKEIAKQGINDLHYSVPFVLSFVEKLYTIVINEMDLKTIYSHETVRRFEDLSIEKITKMEGTSEEVFFIAKLSSQYEALSIAVPVQHINSDQYRILFPNEKTPRQFISFPLVGSENFPFPVVVNSPLFNPDDSRSHVFLNLISDHAFNKKVNLNRDLFEKAIDLFNTLLTLASKLNWENLHYLAKSDLPFNIEDNWYKDSIQKEIRKTILDADIVVTESGKPIKPRLAKFPIYKVNKLEEFWNLCKLLCIDEIPRQEDVEIWKEIVEASLNEWLGIDFDLNLEKLLLLIENSTSFLDFNDKYFKNEIDAFAALNQIIKFTEEEDKELLNRKESPLMIFPNQSANSLFVEKQKLSRDVNVPRELKDVLKTTGDNWYNKLLRDEVTIFERESELTVKFVSDKIRERIEKYFGGQYNNDEKLLLESGLFELVSLATKVNKPEIELVHKYLKQFFPEDVGEDVKEINGSEEFDWKPVLLWAVRTLLKKIDSLETMDNIALHVFNVNYPALKDEYSKVDELIMFKVDSALDEIINYVLKFEKNLLAEYAIVPNQLNILCKYNNEIFNDENIPLELKKIMTDFGQDCRGSLRHIGISIILPSEPRNLKWICGRLDDIAIEESENAEFKQPIRDLDIWISRKKGSITGMDELFKTFYRRRSGIVLNTYDFDERNQFDEILKSGMSSEFANLVKLGTTADMLKEVANVLQTNPDIDSQTFKEIANLLKEHPELNSDKIEQLLQMSNGWNPELNYLPDEVQKRVNFENGWKGEAFVYKELLRKNFEVDWRNKSEIDNGNSIIDINGDKHFIEERFDKYDLVAKHTNGKMFYIQVKSTTTDLSDADQIAMPISVREWNFVFEIKGNDAYYLARVFNLNATPSVYFMKLEKPDELI